MIKGGYEAFESIFNERITGKRTFVRNKLYPSNVPTNVQAEVLIYNKYLKNILLPLFSPRKNLLKENV